MKLKKLNTYAEAVQFVTDNQATIKQEYLQKDKTARVVADLFGIHYNNNFQKALYRVIGPKGKGHGGLRRGSGNKKGISFCGQCRQVKEKCVCK